MGSGAGTGKLAQVFFATSFSFPDSGNPHHVGALSYRGAAALLWPLDLELGGEGEMEECLCAGVPCLQANRSGCGRGKRGNPHLLLFCCIWLGASYTSYHMLYTRALRRKYTYFYLRNEETVIWELLHKSEEGELDLEHQSNWLHNHSNLPLPEDLSAC